MIANHFFVSVKNYHLIILNGIVIFRKVPAIFPNCGGGLLCERPGMVHSIIAGTKRSSSEPSRNIFEVLQRPSGEISGTFKIDLLMKNVIV